MSLAHVDKTGNDWIYYFRENDHALVAGRDAFIEAVRRYYAVLHGVGAFERAKTAETFIVDAIDTAHAGLAEEIREHLEW